VAVDRRSRRGTSCASPRRPPTDSDADVSPDDTRHGLYTIRIYTTFIRQIMVVRKNIHQKNLAHMQQCPPTNSDADVSGDDSQHTLCCTCCCCCCTGPAPGGVGAIDRRRCEEELSGTSSLRTPAGAVTLSTTVPRPRLRHDSSRTADLTH